MNEPHAGRLVQAALGERYTAAVLRVVRGGRVCFERAYGTLDDAPAAAATEVTTRFDLASLTKPFVAHAALEAVAEGALALDRPLALELLPEWRGGAQAAVTARMLLAHNAGLASGADYRELLGRDIVRFALAQPLVAAPGEHALYSDLGFIVLGVALERALGRTLAALVAASCARLGCEATGFRPLGEAAAIPATEDDGWRGRVRGSVHDEKAHLLGGVAGHAGLFGTACDLGRLADAYLGPLCRSRGPGLPSALVREAVAVQADDPVLCRGLGWALKTSDEGSSGALLSRASFGHTGFTGTSLWCDPSRDLAIVLLTNAVYYGRRDLRELRAAVGDAVVREFGERCAQSA